MTAVDLATSASRWWVGVITRTAPEPAGTDRREEMLSDWYEQAQAMGVSEGRTARSILGRAVRGMPDDITWRVGVERTPGRLTWHLGHPTTVLGASLVLQLSIGTLWDATRGSSGAVRPLTDVLHPVLIMLWAVTLGFAVVSVAHAHLRWVPGRLMELESWRRSCICVMSVAYAVAGLWRFVPGLMGDSVSAVWGFFGVALLVYLVLTGVRLMYRLVGLLDFGKVSS